jgi:hypothetical protein
VRLSPLLEAGGILVSVPLGSRPTKPTGPQPAQPFRQSHSASVSLASPWARYLSGPSCRGPWAHPATARPPGLGPAPVPRSGRAGRREPSRGVHVLGPGDWSGRVPPHPSSEQVLEVQLQQVGRALTARAPPGHYVVRREEGERAALIAHPGRAANSRTGVTTRARGPGSGRASRSPIGSRNATRTGGCLEHIRVGGHVLVYR